jgi:hypothetical protein
LIMKIGKGEIDVQIFVVCPSIVAMVEPMCGKSSPPNLFPNY